MSNIITVKGNDMQGLANAIASAVSVPKPAPFNINHRVYDMNISGLAGTSLSNKIYDDNYCAEKALKEFSKYEVPKWRDIIGDAEIIKGMIHLEKSFTMTDNAGNVIIFGYRNHAGNNDTKVIVNNKETPKSFKALYNNGVLRFGVDEAIWKLKYNHSHKRESGGGWKEKEAKELFLPNNNSMWYKELEKIELAGRSEIPHVFDFFGDDPDAWIGEMFKYMTCVVSLGANIFGLGSVVGGLLNNALSLARKLSVGEAIGLNDIVSSVVALAPVAIGDKDDIMMFANKNLGTNFTAKMIEDGIAKVGKIYETGSQAYTAISNGNYAQLGKVLETASYLDDLMEEFKVSNTDAIKKIINKPIEEVEKIVSAVQNSETLKQMTLYSQQIIDEAKSGIGSLTLLPVQQFITNAVATASKADFKSLGLDLTDLTTAIPGGLNAIQSIFGDNKNLNLSLPEVQALINSIQSIPINPDALKNLAMDTLTTKARQYASDAVKMYLPSNLPSDWQYDFQTKIEKRVPRADVRTVAQMSKFKTKFYREYP